MSSVVLSFSGGMDSTVLLYAALEKFDHVILALFDYGQRHGAREIAAANKTLAQIPPERITQVHLQLPFFAQFSGSALLDNTISIAQAREVMGHPQTVNYVPNRNMIFLSILLGLAESKGAAEVWYGAAQADSVAGFYDGSQEFVNAINQVSILNRKHKIKVVAPLLTKSKADIIKWGVDLGVDFASTWTCYEGKTHACGTCTSCALRLKGFIDAGIRDPLEYSVPIDWSRLLKTSAA